MQERERWQLVLAGNHDGIWDSNIRTGEIFYSARWKNMLGFEEEELPNAHEAWRDRIHPEDRHRILSTLDEYCARKIDHYGAEYRMRAKDGTYRWILARGQAVWSEDGLPVRIVGSHSDVTEQRLAQEALRQSERYFRSLIENALDIITILESDGRIRYESPSIKHVLGYEPTSMLGKYAFDFMHPDDKESIRATFHRMMRKPMASEHVRLRFQHNDGSWRVLDAIAMNLLEDPAVRGFVVNSRDVTNQQLAEERLRESESRLAAAQAVAHVGNWELDLYSGAGYWSEETYRIFGVPLGTEITLDVFLSAVLEEDHKAVETARFRAIQDKTPYSVDYRLMRPDGTVRCVVSNGELIFENGGLVRMHGTVQDITDRKQLEEELRQAQKLQAIGRLAGGVAHDFNNLLTVILGQTNVVYRHLDEANPLRAKLAEVKYAGERAASVIQQLLAFSRKQVLQPRVLNLNALLKNLGDFLQRLIGEHITLRMTLDPDLGSINADATQVEQVVMNLAANARDAMPDGGILLIQTRNVEPDEKSANIGSLDAGSYLVLSISDTGCGMGAETKANLFDPFFTTKEQGKGTGLGLSMVYGIVEQSKGSIVVHSEVGQGSTFKIYLPRVAGVQIEDVQDTPPEMVHAPAVGTILLIEDDSGIRRLAQEILDEAGYTVLEAGTGAEAILIAEKLGSQLNLIISDVVMPGMSGPDTVKHIKGIAGTSPVPVLYTSGYTDHSLVTRAALAETLSCRFLHKPFLPDSLLQAVKDILSGSSR
jgi:PAS domain S-box-containing protein